jgi:hypothetical protein
MRNREASEGSSPAPPTGLFRRPSLMDANSTFKALTAKYDSRAFDGINNPQTKMK